MAKTIKIFLVDGEPNGLKTAELSNWVGQAIIIPRKKLKEIKERPDCNKPAVYFLIGKEDEGALLLSAYIGEAEVLWSRLTTHDGSKDFWQTVVAFVSKDSNLTKAHVKYLESRCVEIATRAKRFNLVNGAKPSSPSLSEADIAEMEEFLDNLELLLTAVGYPILQEVTSKEHGITSDPLFTCSGKNALATGRMTNEGFVVYKDSTATTSFSPTFVKKNKERNVAKLVDSGYLAKKNDFYVFTKDYVFSSPTAASDVILGHPASGREVWKTADGRTLNEVYEEDN